jgi:hypothetical protein
VAAEFHPLEAGVIVTIGKGHLAEAKAAINSPAAGARGAFSH